MHGCINLRMKAIPLTAVLLASLALHTLPLSAQDQQDPVLKAVPIWIHNAGTRNILFSILNTGDTPVTLAPKITFSRATPNPPKDAQKSTLADTDTIQVSIEFPVPQAGQDAVPLPAQLSPDKGDHPIQIPAGKTNRDLSYIMGDDFQAALKASGSFTCRATYHGKVLGEKSFDEKGNMTGEYDGRRHIIVTYSYDDNGKRIGQQATLADDPDYRVVLAAKEKDLLAQLKYANANPMPHQVRNQPRDDALRDLAIFYTCESLEFDKAANLQFSITNPEDLYSLRVSLATNCKTFAEQNKKLEELVRQYPEKKAFTENLMVK